MNIQISMLGIIKIKSLKIRNKLRNKLIDIKEFNEEYNKFMNDFTKFEYYKSEKEPGSVSPNQKK